VGPVTLSRNRARLWFYRERYPEAAGFRGIPVKLDVSAPGWPLRLGAGFLAAGGGGRRSADADAQGLRAMAL
jgi:hypothetical protein